MINEPEPVKETSQVPFGLSEAAWNALVDDPDSDQILTDALRIALGGPDA